MERSDPYLQQAATEILAEMYEEAEPPLDIHELQNNPDEYSDESYTDHYLPYERQKEIFNKHMENLNLTKKERRAMKLEVLLNLSPSTVPSE